jgi:hypothetical protein
MTRPVVVPRLPSASLTSTPTQLSSWRITNPVIAEMCDSWLAMRKQGEAPDRTLREVLAPAVDWEP